MNFSSRKGQPGPGLLPSRMNTGALQKILEEVISAEESELHSVKPSFLQEKKSLQKRKSQKVLTYARQLDDPRWKAKRQVILTRDEFNCANCGANSSLHVHHIKYTGYAWEAPDKDLITLCNVCHKKVHKGTLEVVINEKLYVRSKGIYLGKFLVVFSAATIRVVKEAREALPTLMVLVANVERENLARVRANLIAHTIGVSLATVYRQLKELQQTGIIEPDPAEGEKPRAVFNWRICPYVAWKGKVEDIPHYLKTLPNNHKWHTFND